MNTNTNIINTISTSNTLLNTEIDGSPVIESAIISVHGRNWYWDAKRTTVACAITQDQRIHIQHINGVDLSLEALYAVSMKWKPLADALDAVNPDTRKYPAATRIVRTGEGDFNVLLLVNEDAVRAPWLLNVAAAWHKVVGLHVTTANKVTPAPMWIGDLRLLLGALVDEVRKDEFELAMRSFKAKDIVTADGIQIVTRGRELN